MVYPVPDRLEADLEPVDQARVDDIVDRYRGEHGILMPVLQDINEEYRYLPGEILRYVARKLDVPLSQVFQVATFYNAFSLTPRGKHTVNVCTGTSCHVRGSARILESLEQHLGIGPGETTEDLQFSLETVRCLGCCALSPCVVVGEKTHARLRPDTVAALIGECA
ncbi:MAG: NAD(P)H-dependent oxidoreductase subunit E [Gemmatimonadales bacterium]|nr:NAD(P)H-dependent oxidoreductase subunit E [Gemmatimonadales bacterium]